jgi:hypothetical protein
MAVSACVNRSAVISSPNQMMICALLAASRNMTFRVHQSSLEAWDFKEMNRKAAIYGLNDRVKPFILSFTRGFAVLPGTDEDHQDTLSFDAAV